MAPEENGGGVDTLPDAEADGPTTVLDSQDKFDVTSSSITEEPQAEDIAEENLNSTSHDSQIIVENVASASEEAKKDTAVLVVSEEVSEVYKETVTLNEVGEVRVLRKRTIVSTPTTKPKCTRHNQKELAEVAEDNEVATVEVVQELVVTGVGEPEETASVKENAVAMEELNEGQQVQEEKLTKETEMAKGEETEVEEMVLKEGSSEPPDSAVMALTEENMVGKVTETSQKGEEADSSDRLSDDDMGEPPVVQRRGLRGRCKVITQLESTKTQGHEVEHVDEDDLETGGAAGEEQGDKKAVDQQMENLTVVEEGRIPEADDITPPTEVSVEESQEVQEEPETASATEMQEEEAKDVIQEPVTATATSVPEEKLLEETALAGTKEMQETDSCCETPKLHQATVILVDLKATGLHLSVRMAEQIPTEGECSAPEREELELMTPEQTPEPEMLLLDEEDAGKQENDTEKSADTATGVETSEKGALKEDSLNEENKESFTLDEEKVKAEEAPIIETRVLRSGRKAVRARTQELEEGNVDKVNKKNVPEAQAQADAGEGGGEMEPMETDAVTIPGLVEDGLSEQEAGNNEEEECAVTTRTRRGRKSASASTKSKRKRMCKEIQEEESKEAGDSKTRKKEEADMGGAVEKSSKEREERMEEGAASDSPDDLKQKMDVEEEETVAEEGQDNVAEEQSEAKFAEKEASGEEYDESNVAVVGEETEPPVGSVTRSLRSGGKTPRAPLKHRPRRSTKQPGEEKWEDRTSAEKSATDHKAPTASVKSQEDGALPETAEKAMAQDDKQDEAELGSAKDPTKDDKGTAQEVDEIQVEMEEPVAVEVEKEVLEKGPSDEDGNKKVTVVLVDLKSTHHKVQEEISAGERQAGEEEEQDEEQNQIIEHQSGEKSEVADATNVEPETASENGHTGAKEAVTLLETVPDETEADEVITTQGTEEGEQHTTKSDMAPAEGEEAKGVSDVDEAPVKETTVLRSGEKADERENEATREKSAEAEASVDRRVLRKGRRSAAATPRRKSKRARTQLNTEEEGEDKITSAEEMQTEEESEENKKTGAQAGEKSEESEEDYEQEIGEDPVGQQGETTEAAVALKTVETVAEQSLSAQQTVEEQSALLETCANERRETPVEEMNTEEATDEEQPPVFERRVLRSCGEVVKVPSGSQDAQSQQDENIQEGAADKMIEEKDGDGSAAQKEEKTEMEMEDATVAEESMTKQEPAEELTADESGQEGTAAEKTSDTDEQAKGRRVLRKKRRYALATPRHKAKRACKWQAEHEEKERTEGEEEEPGQDKDVKKEVDGEVEGEPAVGDSEEMKDESTEAAAVPEKEDDSMPIVVETRTVAVKVQEMDSAKREETTAPENPGAAKEGFHSAVAEEEPLVTDASVSAEEEAPTVTSRLRRSKTKSSQATPSRRSSKRNNQGVVETQQQQVEDDPEDEKTQEDLPGELRAEEQAGTDETSLVGLEAENSTEEAEEIADLIDDKASASEELQELSSSEQENTLSLGLSTDDVQVESTGLNQDDKEDEQNMSEEEVEPIVIGKKILRGRTVPSVTITPQSKSRRHNTKVRKSDECLSEERSPQDLCKRRGTEVTPARKFKRHSRV